MNIFDYLNDSLEDAKDKFVDKLEDFKELVENKLKYNKAENTLEDYFQTDGKDIYKELTKLDMNNNAYFFVTRQDFIILLRKFESNKKEAVYSSARVSRKNYVK